MPAPACRPPVHPPSPAPSPLRPSVAFDADAVIRSRRCHSSRFDRWRASLPPLDNPAGWRHQGRTGRRCGGAPVRARPERVFNPIRGCPALSDAARPLDPVAIRPAIAAPPAQPLAGALWMAGSVFGFSAIAVAGRELGHVLDTFEIMLYRSLIGIVVVLGAAMVTGRTAEITTRHMGWHMLRNAVHFAGQNLWLYALALIPMAQLFALEFSYPIIVALTAPLFLGERLTPVRVLAAAVGFAGILIVARPFGAGGLSVGLVAAILCALGFAGSAIVTKRLTQVVTITCILFWLAVMQSALGLFLAAIDGVVALPPPTALPWVAVMGLGGLGAHFCLTKALSLAPASVVTPIDFLRLPLIALVGMALYREPLDIWVLAGGAVILAANWTNIAAENRGRGVITPR